MTGDESEPPPSFDTVSAHSVIVWPHLDARQASELLTKKRSSHLINVPVGAYSATVILRFGLDSEVVGRYPRGLCVTRNGVLEMLSPLQPLRDEVLPARSLDVLSLRGHVAGKPNRSPVLTNTISWCMISLLSIGIARRGPLRTIREFHDRRDVSAVFASAGILPVGCEHRKAGKGKEPWTGSTTII